MMRNIVVPVAAALGVLLGTAWADDAAVVAELKKAGINAGKSRSGGYSVSVKSAADLTEEVWKRLEALDLRSFWLSDASAFGDAEMTRLCGIRSLEYIFLNSPRVSEAGITALGKLPKLREFNVHHLMGKEVFRGAGLAALKDTPSFEAMEFGGATIDDKGLEAIGQLSHLKKLGIYHAEITTVGFPNLAKLSNLEKLALEPTFTPNYTGSDFRHLTGLANLRELLVKKMVLSYEDGLSHLARLKALKKLTFVECGIDAADLARLKEELPETQVDFTPAAAKDVARWNELLAKRKK